MINAPGAAPLLLLLVVLLGIAIFVLELRRFQQSPERYIAGQAP